MLLSWFQACRLSRSRTLEGLGSVKTQFEYSGKGSGRKEIPGLEFNASYLDDQLT